jgi:TP901 family phage tail tape measure protein
VSSKSLSFLLFGEDVTAGKAFRKVAAEAEAASGTVKKSVFGGVGTALVGGAFVTGVGLAVRSAIKFQSEMLLVQTQAGASAAEVKTMSGEILKLAGPVATAPEALANSLYHVESIGLRGAKALDVVRIAAEGAKVGHADLEQTTNALTASVASGITGVQNMTQAMGALNTIVGSGDMKMQDLNEALGTGLLSVVKGYGLSLTDVGAALATFGDNNIRGADAATMLRMAVQAMAVPAAKGKAELTALGLSTTTLARDMQTGGLNKAVLDLKDHLDKAGVSSNQVGQILTEVFGKKAGPGIAVLIGQVARLETKYADLHKGAGSFSSDWNTWLKSNQGQMDQLTNHVKGLEVEYGTKLLPVLNDGVKFLNNNSTAVIGVVGGLVGLKVAIGAVKFAQEAWTAAAVIGTGVQKLLGIQAGTTALALDGEAAAARAAAAAQAGGTSSLAGSGAAVVGTGEKMTTTLGKVAKSAGLVGVGISLATAAQEENKKSMIDSNPWATKFSKSLDNLAHSLFGAGSNAKLSSQDVDILSHSVRVLPSGKVVLITVPTAPAANAISYINGLLNSLGSKTVTPQVNTGYIPGVSKPPGHASGGYLDPGWNEVGEQGPERVWNGGGNNSPVMSASATRAAGKGGSGDIHVHISGTFFGTNAEAGKQLVGAIEKYFNVGGTGQLARGIR